ncbi:MAG TPA: carbamoyltransferase C-terminal domain-containing protein [Phycisphaerae bacterium]
MAHYILGVHDGHNASAAILKNGELLFAIQEERLSGIKNHNGFPFESVKACLDFARIAPKDVAQLALVTMRRTPMGQRSTDMAAAFRRDASLYGMARRLGWYAYIRVHENLGWKERQRCAASLGFAPAQLQRYDHHLGHAATAYFGMREVPHTPYLVVTLDGSGDLSCGTISTAQNGQITRIATTPLTDSLGTIYAFITGAMGFVPLEHEYKLMGMAPYAAEKYARQVADQFHALLRVDEDALRFRRSTWEPTFCYNRRLKDLISGLRFDNVCAGLQLFTEDLMVQLIRAAIRKTGIRRVLCAGGVFMNVKANKRIMEMPEVDYLAVAPSSGDETMCMGIAWYAHALTGGAGAADGIPPLGPFFLGSDVHEDDAAAVVKDSGHEHTRHDDIEAEVARLLAAGHPVARCKGRMEFGARALGNRSILADPRNQDIVRIINQMVKKRDFWMPFAPVVRRERIHEYVSNPKNFPSPYMMLTFDARENFRDFIAAVHNADLTARMQVLEESHNPEYYRILKLFEGLTGRGVLLNTSFNLHGYPIVLGPKEALFVFDNSGLTYLAVGQYLVKKAVGPGPWRTAKKDIDRRQPVGAEAGA